MKGLIRTPRAHLIAKLILAAWGSWAIWVLRGPWWYVSLIVFALMWLVMDAVQAYRRETRTPGE